MTLLFPNEIFFGIRALPLGQKLGQFVALLSQFPRVRMEGGASRAVSAYVFCFHFISQIRHNRIILRVLIFRVEENMCNPIVPLVC